MKRLRGHAVLCLLALLASPVAAATSEAVLTGGFGRLAIDWNEPLTLSSRRTGDLLEIEASRPFPPDVTGVADALASLLETLTLDDQGRIMRLRPVAGVTVEAVFLNARSIRIGLVAPDTPTLRLRLGEHDGFRRVVLEPVVQSSVQLIREAGRVALLLPGRLSPADRQRLERVPGLAEVAMAGNQLFLTLEPGATVRELFVEPDKQVLDISSTGLVHADDDLSSDSQAREPPETLPARTAPRPTPRPDRMPAALAKPGSPDSAAAASETALSGEAMATSAALAPPTLAALTIDAVEGPAGTVALRFVWPEPVPAAVFVRGSQLWVAFAASGRSIDIEPKVFTQVARRFVKSVRQEPHATATLFQLGLNDAAVTSIDRDGGQWRIHLADLAASATEPRVPPLAPMVDETGGGLLLSGIDAVVSFTDPIVGDRLDLGLALALTGAVPTPQRFVGLRLLPALQGAVWRSLVEGDRQPQLVAEGLVLGPLDGVVRATAGDVAPAVALVDSLPVALDLTALDEPATAPPPRPASSIGGTLPHDDHPPSPERTPATSSTATAEGTGETDAAADDAASSAGSDAFEGSGSKLPPQPSPLGLEPFAATPERPFWDLRAALLQAANEALAGDRQAVQLDLARLHVVNGLGAEAVSLLAGMPASGGMGEDAVAAAAHRALEGAARVLTGRHDQALARLAHDALFADDETALWRAAARAALDDWDAALADWRRGQEYLSGYPAQTQAALGEHGIMLLLQTGQIDDALTLLARLAALPLPNAARDRLRLLEATALERDGALDEARVIWRALASDGVLEVRSRALRALVDSDLAVGRIAAAEAVERLAAASVQWRGQSEEVDLWRRLAELRHAAGQGEAALATLQESLARAPATSQSGAIAADMAGIVDDLFGELADGQRSATAMLLTYRRFAELVPAGPAGDAHVVLLASELEKIGLDEAAIELLRDRLQQSDARDAGRPRLGLALARLLAAGGDQRGAIEALLDSTSLDEIDPSLAAARRELLAALGHAGAPASGGETMTDARRLTLLRDRTRLAFDDAAWQEVVAAAGPLEASLPPTGLLERPAAELVLMVATAARQRADDALVDHLAQRYADRLAADDRSVLLVLATGKRFGGDATDILDDAARHADRMRDVIRPSPPA